MHTAGKLNTPKLNTRGLDIPFFSFGNVTSDNLFDDKEQRLFDFYDCNASRYRRALDIGANIGVHAILMTKAGWRVQAFEPDPIHFQQMVQNYRINREKPYMLHRVAVGDRDGEETFVRVKGNTTGSHLKGDKHPYGELEEFTVEVVDCQPLFEWADFCKMDCEGHEATLLLRLEPDDGCDFMVEVGNRKNANLIFNHMRHLRRRMWSQKRDWKEVQFFGDMPVHHSEGALFIGEKRPFP